MKKISILVLVFAVLLVLAACGKEPAPCEHSFDSGVVTTAATCTAPGVMTITCTKCGEAKTTPLPVNSGAHTYELAEVITPATCACGSGRYVCSGCHAEKTDEIPPVREHIYSGTVLTPASVNGEGEMLYTCSVCKGTKTEPIPKLDAEAVAALEAEWDAEWNSRFDAVTDPVIREKVEALYALFDPEKLVTWWASLYDPATGGFYYANSARDTEGFLPDLESTYQITNIAKEYGMVGQKYRSITELYGPTITQNILNFYYSCESESDGYFYHPQFPDVIKNPKKYDMRVSRDLEWGDTMIRWLGGKAPYPTALDRLRAAAPADNGVILLASGKNQFNDVETMKAYVKNQIETTGFEGWGNTLSSALEQYRAGGTLNALIDLLNTYQDPETGIWGGYYRDGSFYAYNDSYQSVDSTMTMTYKTLKLYAAAGRTVPYAKQLTDTAVNAALAISSTTRVTYTYNPWATLTQLRTCVKNQGAAGDYEYYTQKIADNASAMLDALINELKRFRYTDGSFSYYPKRSQDVIYGTTVSLGKKEGDVNGTLLALTSVYNSACYVLGVPQIPMFNYQHADLFRQLLSEAKTPVKSPQ